MSQSLSCVSKILSTTGKGRIYKYGGQHNYECVTTHVDLAILFPQIGVDTLGSTGRRTGREGGRTLEPTSRVGGQRGDQGIRENGGDDEFPDFFTVIAQQLQDLLPTIIAQVGNHASNIEGDVRSVNMGNGQNGCSYKEFMACNLKDYDGKGGAIVYTSWIEKMESVQDMSGCAANQKVLMSKEFCPNNEMQKLETKFWCHAMVGAGHAAYTDRFHELARLIRAMVAATELTTIQSAVLKVGMLTEEAIRNGSLKKNTEKRGNGRELSMNENVMDDNKRSKTGKAFSTITNPVRKEYTDITPKAGPRMVTPVNARNPTTAQEACRIKNGNQARGGAFMMGAEEARQDPNNMTGTFTLNNHYATTLFDFGADYSFVSTTFIPLLDTKPSDLGFSYEIEIASGQLVEINKVIRGCKLEIEGHTFDINLIPFRHGSFDVILGMD
ncbi:putative reverse transcriptase domain-containing protein [Tanacetum coccineum]